MTFVETIFERMARFPERVVLVELRPQGDTAVTAQALMERVAAARAFLANAGLEKGDRCVLVAANSIAWVALDLAAMAEGIIVVPLYARQAPAELAVMIRDCEPRLICCGDPALSEAVRKAWRSRLDATVDATLDTTNRADRDAPGAGVPRIVLLEDVMSTAQSDTRGEAAVSPVRVTSNDPVAIIYTSGTSGEAKGVVLTAANVTHMLGCTTARLDELMDASTVSDPTHVDEVFHYLPFCFAASWILLLSCLSRASTLRLCVDLGRLADELRAAKPDYCLNVPALLERMRSAIEGQLATRGGVPNKIFVRAKSAWLARQNGASSNGAVWLALGRALIFPAIRKKLGPNLKALICGSAPLARETQLLFVMLGIPVLQGYGLTETTGICTLDQPHHVEPGAVGPRDPGN